MPRVTYLNTPQIRLQKASKALCALGGVIHQNCRTGEDMAKVLGLSPARALARGKEPGSLKLDELARLCVNLGYSCEIRLEREGVATTIEF